MCARAVACVCPGALACACAWVRVVLFIQHETHMLHIVTTFVDRLSPPYFPTLFHNWHDFWEKAIEHTIHWWGQRNMYSMEQRHSWEANRSSVRKFSAFYENRRFITAFTRVSHLYLSWARSIQSMPPSHFSNIHFNTIQILRRSLLPSGFPTKTLYVSLPHTCYMPCPSQSSWFDHKNDTCWGVQSTKLLVM